VGRIDSAGRLVIPSRFRKRLGLRSGDEVTVVLEGTTLRVMSTAEAIRQAQALVRQYIPAQRRLSRELMSERHQAAARE
jgi:AbrB family looped-hinge helix DNA binding protein